MNSTTSVQKQTNINLGQGVHGVEIASGQVSNRMVLGELGEAPDSLVDILLLY
jgi:O-acetylhomoserine/O-acetylserine sulfhydrylase-like pyridoxal-dependent enzyme